MPLVETWCVMYCGFHPALSSPTPSVGHMTGDMKRRESNQTHSRTCHTNRNPSSFSTKHFQNESLKIFNLHPPLRRLILFVARIITWKVRRWVIDTQTDNTVPLGCACTPKVKNALAHYEQSHGYDQILHPLSNTHGLLVGAVTFLTSYPYIVWTRVNYQAVSHMNSLGMRLALHPDHVQVFIVSSMHVGRAWTEAIVGQFCALFSYFNCWPHPASTHWLKTMKSIGVSPSMV